MLDALSGECTYARTVAYAQSLITGIYLRDSQKWPFIFTTSEWDSGLTKALWSLMTLIWALVGPLHLNPTGSLLGMPFQIFSGGGGVKEICGWEQDSTQSSESWLHSRLNCKKSVCTDYFLLHFSLSSVNLSVYLYVRPSEYISLLEIGEVGEEVRLEQLVMGRGEMCSHVPLGVIFVETLKI